MREAVSFANRVDLAGDNIERQGDHHGHKSAEFKKYLKKVPTRILQYLHHQNMGHSGVGDHPTIPAIHRELKSRNAHKYTDPDGVYEDTDLSELSVKTLKKKSDNRDKGIYKALDKIIDKT
jgi:hypothetical protein